MLHKVNIRALQELHSNHPRSSSPRMHEPRSPAHFPFLEVCDVHLQTSIDCQFEQLRNRILGSQSHHTTSLPQTRRHTTHLTVNTVIQDCDVLDDNLSWARSIANTTFIELANTRIYIITNAITILIAYAVTTADAQSILIQARVVFGEWIVDVVNAVVVDDAPSPFNVQGKTSSSVVAESRKLSKPCPGYHTLRFG